MPRFVHHCYLVHRITVIALLHCGVGLSLIRACVCMVLTCCIFWRMTKYIFFPYFQNFKLTVGDLKVQNSQTKFDHPLNMSTNQRFVFYSQFCHEGFFKHFLSLANSVLNIKKKLDAVSLFLKACHIIGLQWLQKVLNVDTFKHQLHKLQCSVLAVNWPSIVVQLYYIWLASRATSPETFSSYLVCPGDEAKDKEKSTVSVIGSAGAGSLGPGNEDCCIQKPLRSKQLNDYFDQILREAEGKHKSHCYIKCENFMSCPKMLAGIFFKEIFCVCWNAYIKVRKFWPVA
jgi:hypothetical protein